MCFAIVCFQVATAKKVKVIFPLITNKHNQKLINILENQKIYGGFLQILIFRFSLSKWVLESETRNISFSRKPP